MGSDPDLYWKLGFCLACIIIGALLGFEFDHRIGYTFKRFGGWKWRDMNEKE